ncbi:MAG TPA: hypothetical protein VGR35_19875, partial [Tepidisphaeraceae bacterium]|nr:hypothetical protein [Tepidisphaeraceae bacterium]
MKRRLFNVATGLSLALFLAGACLWMRSYASGGRIFARALFRYGSYGGAMSYLLVVDDDLDSRDVLCRFLIRAGHECVAVPNGSEAMESILARMPDLIVLDLLM